LSDNILNYLDTFLYNDQPFRIRQSGIYHGSRILAWQV